MANILEELWRGNVVPYGSVQHAPFATTPPATPFATNKEETY